MRIAIITDTHIGIRSDSLIFHDYFAKFYKKFVEDLKKENITTIFHLGDLFDRRKYINFETLKRSKEYLFDLLENEGIMMYVLLGNHDVYHKSNNDTNSPELLLKEYSRNIIVIDKVATSRFGNRSFLFVPWINTENYSSSMRAIASSRADVMLSHLELAGFEMYRGFISEHGMPIEEELDKFELVLSGHYHHKSSRNNIHYLGAPYPMTWSDYGDDRGYHIIDTETLKLEYIITKDTLFKKIIYADNNLDEIDFSEYMGCYVKVVIKSKENIYNFDKFLEELNNVNPADISIAEEEFVLETSDGDDEIIDGEDTTSILRRYCEFAGSDLPDDQKTSLTNLILSLHQQALLIE